MSEQGSKPGRLGEYDWKKIGKGSLFAGIGGIVAYLCAAFGVQVDPNSDLTAQGLALFTALAPIIGNMLWKLATDTRPKTS